MVTKVFYSFLRSICVRLKWELYRRCDTKSNKDIESFGYYNLLKQDCRVNSDKYRLTSKD